MKIFNIIVVFITLVSLLVSGCGQSAADTGMLTGKVTIGPLVPVERPGDDYEIPCEVYEARKIMVYDKNRKKLVKQVDIDCDGFYQVELPPDSYVIDINRSGIDSSAEVPLNIEIKSGETVQLNIDIDTGIR